MKRQLQAQSAYSLVFAFLLMTVLLLIAGITIQNTIEKVAFYNEMEGSAQASLAAESSAELGITTLKDYGPGYEDSAGEVFCEDPTSSGTCQSWADFIILAEQKAYNGRYYAPIFGTGTAGNAEDCSVLDYIDLDTGETNSSVTIDVDEPCHWNKLLYGDSVTIPLFDIDDSTGNPLNPSDLGLTSWNLKIRTPCSDGTMDSGCTRYEFNLDGKISGEGDTVVFWQLIGEDSSGNTLSLIPNDETAYSFTARTDTREAGPENTEIYESLLNDAIASNFNLLDVYNGGYYGTLFDFSAQTDLVSLYLQMDIVTPLLDSTNASIPYLEWQIEVDSTNPLADFKSIAVGEGYFTGARNTFYATHILSRRSTGENANIYTLSN